MKYSIIVPVYNRPDEVDELLDSLTRQAYSDFEVIIVEDGSAIPCKDVCEKYANSLPLHYFLKENSGPGQSRNYGAERAKGDYLIILDSDVVLPDGYLKALDQELTTNPCEAFGGADASHPSFTPVQKAISYSMTSFFTTGGIRGGKAKLDKFYPRSYNMGIKREVYQQLGGFSKMRFGEDIDFSYRIVEAGHKCRLFPTACVPPPADLPNPGIERGSPALQEDSLPTELGGKLISLLKTNLRLYKNMTNIDHNQYKNMIFVQKQFQQRNRLILLHVGPQSFRHIFSHRP